MKRARISRSKFLEILQKRMESEEIKMNEFTAIARLYAEVMGWKERIRPRKDKKEYKKQTIDDFIIHMENSQKDKEKVNG